MNRPYHCAAGLRGIAQALPGIAPRLRAIALSLGVIALLLSGCAKDQPLRPRKLGPPLLDLSKGAGSLPLAHASTPTSAEELKGSLLEGYRGRLLLAAAAEDTVRVEGASLDHLSLLAMDVSGAHVRSGYRPRAFAGRTRVLRSLRVHQMQFLAQPLILDTAQMYLRLEAEDSLLQLMQDDGGRSGLVLAGAKQGFAELAISDSDLQQSFREAARRGAAAAGAKLEEAEMVMHSDRPDSLWMWARLKSRWLLLPLTFRVYGRLTVDESFYVSFSDVSCEGEDPLGALAASFINTRMRKMQETLSPLMRFGDGRTHVTFFHVDTDDGLRAVVGFGR